MSQAAEFERTFEQAERIQARLRLPYNTIEPLAALVDAALIVGSSIVAGVGYHQYFYSSHGDVEVFIGIGLVAAILYIFIANSSHLYQFQKLLRLDRYLTRITVRWLFAIMALTVLMFLFKISADFSRGAIVLFGSIALVSLLIARSVVARSLRWALTRGAVVGHRVVLVGEREELALLRHTDLLARFGVSEIGRVTVSKATRGSIDPALKQKDLAAVDQALRIARHNNADEVVLALQWSDRRRLELIRDRLRESPLPVRLLPDRATAEILKAPLRYNGVVSVELQRGPLTISEQIQKRVLDFVVAGAAIIMLSPLLLLVALAIRLDSRGPVIFRQRRNGFNGRPFMIAKFRTMNVLEDGTQIRQATRNDARVTRLGRVLRRTSIDELPQLFNVLRGQMSLIGPRPHALAHDDLYASLISTYAFRHHVKPGITGWAQIKGCRGETEKLEQMERRIEFDLWYINNWSFWLDIRILVQTCIAVLRSTKAY
jgi:undecaprenyl-phosphate galactose phosphotransferase/putative colanic acid biosynthesis UDP-glucose lipid carrier transferase